MKDDVKMEAETGVLYLQVPKIIGNHQKLGERHETEPLSNSPEETNPADTLVLDFCHMEL